MNTIISELNNQSLFNAKLLELFNEESSEEKSKCLISNELLDKDCINLLCNHSFNYGSIFNEIYAQKGPKKSFLEIQRLSKNEIKCPYCRRIHIGILPYRIGFPKIKFVNWPPSLVLKNHNCSVLLKSGKRKGLACGKSCYEKYCPLHIKILHNQANASFKTKINTDICEAILKSGKRKGQKCGCNLNSKKNRDNKRCGKHLKLIKDIK